ncbi:MAG: NusA-like transcription termination signal-binding factor [Nanoarchaeota archaeon]
MSRITYNADSLKIMFLFEKTTRIRLKDFFVDDNNLTSFVVAKEDLGKAIGKNASNVKKLESLLKKKVRMIGFTESEVEFTKNLVHPLKVQVEFKEGVITLKSDDTKTKAFLIGRNQSNIKNNLTIIRKYFKHVQDLKVN